jgi:hypothetical protein
MADPKTVFERGWAESGGGSGDESTVAGSGAASGHSEFDDIG